MKNLAEIFGEEKLSYAEFTERTAGAEIGDLTELKKSHAEELRRLRVSGAVEREAMLSGAKDVGILVRILDEGKITVEDDGVHGVTEQIGKLRETAPYLFEDTDKSVKSDKSAKGTEAFFRATLDTGMRHGRDRIDPDSLSDEEYYRMRNAQRKPQ